MKMLYRATRVLTAPGALIRAFWTQLLCRIWMIPVEDTRVFRRGETFGYLTHAEAATVGGAFALAFVPALLNALLALMLFCSSFLGLFVFQMTGWASGIANVLAYWVAVSLYVNSYPSKADAFHMKHLLREEGTTAQKLCFTVGAVCCDFGSLLERTCVTVLIAAGGLAALIAKQEALLHVVTRLLAAPQG